MSGKVVFLGPSLDYKVAEEIADGVEYLPPVQRGDIDRLLARQTPPSVIGIVDGCFLHAMSISPKEILVALDRGIKVLGSSSMGALRAAELDTMGMTGTGEIYRRYRDGDVEDDDEVAITFDPDTLRPQCLPMVSIRIAVERAVDGDRISADEGRAVIEQAKALYFPDRSWANVESVIARTGIGAVRAADIVSVLASIPDAKSEDAAGLIRLVARSGEGK